MQGIHSNTHLLKSWPYLKITESIQGVHHESQDTVVYRMSQQTYFFLLPLFLIYLRSHHSLQKRVILLLL